MKSIKITDYLGFGAFWVLVQICRILPFRVLYGFSYLLYLLIYYVLPLRKRVALENLTNSFPELNQKDIKEIYKQHVHYMCDMFLETFKGFSLDQTVLSARWKVANPDFMKQYQNKSIIIITGHYANWEWGVSLQEQLQHTCANIYKPLRNSLINQYLLNARQKMNVTAVAVKDTPKYFLNHRKKSICYVLIADQHPGGTSYVHWIPFLNQETAFVMGPERYAKNFDYPVVYAAIAHIKRGYYEVTFHPVTNEPKNMPEGEITEKSMRILEAQIRAKPAYWMWGHKRWKLKKNA